MRYLNSWILFAILSIELSCNDSGHQSIKRDTALQVEYYTNGKISKKYYLINNVVEDTVYAYDSTGNLTDKFVYNKGVLNGCSMGFHKNGSLRYKRHIQNGHSDYQIEYDSSGHKKEYKKWESYEGSQGDVLTRYISFNSDGMPDTTKPCFFYTLKIVKVYPEEIDLQINLTCAPYKSIQLLSGGLDSSFRPIKGGVVDTANLNLNTNRVRIKKGIGKKNITCVMLSGDSMINPLSGQMTWGIDVSYIRIVSDSVR